MTKKKKQKQTCASSPEVLNPVGDHPGRLEAAMGVYQCVFFVLFFLNRSFSATEAALADERASRGRGVPGRGRTTTAASQ